MTISKLILTRLYLYLALLGFIFSISIAQEESVPLIRNNLQVKAVLKEESSIYRSPSTSSKIVDKAYQFSILFVFSADGSSSITKNGFYHVGKRPHRAIGWIHNSHVVSWDHRGCVLFTPIRGRKPTKVYKSLPDLKTTLRSGYSSRIKPIAEEPGDVSNMQFAMLIPVLSKQTISVDNQPHTALQIAYLASNKGTQTVGNTNRKNNPRRSYLDILFVLDTTLSMTPYIEKTKDIIDEISRKAIGMRESGVRIGLLCYRDHGDPDYVTERFCGLTTRFSKVKNILGRKVHAGADTIGIPEAVFDGLHAGITETDWGKGTGLRIIILVGDASSHQVGDNNPMDYDIDEMVNLASKNRVRIIALKIVSNFYSDNRIHESQLKKLAQGKTAGDRGSFHKIEISPFMTSTYVDQVASSVEVEIARMARLMDIERDNDGWDDIPKSERAIILKNLIPRRNTSSQPEFSNGWISEKNYQGEVQVKPYVFLSFDDLALTIYYMHAVISLTKSPTERVVGTIIADISAHTGENIQKGQEFIDHYQKKLGIILPSKLLAFSLKEILSWNERRRIDLAESIKSKVRMLEDHRDDPAVWFTTGGDFRYTFVPLDYFP